MGDRAGHPAAGGKTSAECRTGPSGIAHTGQVLTRAERLISGLAAVCVLGGVAVAAQDEPEPPRAVVVPVALPSPAADPTTAPPTRKPAPKPSAAPAKGPLPAPPANPQSGCPVVRKPGAKPYSPKPLAPPKVADSALPKALPPGPKATDLSAVSGKGVWVTTFGKQPLDVRATVAKAKRSGASSLWVRTGGSRQGYYGDQFLPALVPQAHAAGMTVVAWDFPFLSDPVADAERARRALAAGIDAFSPDVETSAEGTFATSRRVSLYLSLVRRHAGTRPVVATVPRPTPKRIASFPYKAFPAYADVFAPMVYWSCKEPGALVQESMAFLGKMLPVHPVGQAYDMGSEGGRRGTPTRAETWRFLDKSKRSGAIGAGLWTIEHAGPAQLTALADYPWRVDRGEKK
jgi:hypothetical protein